MKRFYIIVIPLFFAAIISGFFFGSVSKSGTTGNNFYNYLQTKNYKAIIGLLDESAFDDKSKREWLFILKSRNFLLGESFDFKNTGFHTSTIENVNITKLDYTIEKDNEIVYESIDLIRRDDGYKILNYHFKEKITLLEN